MMYVCVCVCHRQLYPSMPVMTAQGGTRKEFQLLHSKSLGTRIQENKQNMVRIGFPVRNLENFITASSFLIHSEACFVLTEIKKPKTKTKTSQGLAKLCNFIYK